MTPTIADLDGDATYVFSASGTEPRARATIWDDCARQRVDQCLEVIGGDGKHVSIQVGGGTIVACDLNDDDALAWLMTSRPTCYIDISGMSHPVWASLLRVALGVCRDVKAVYAEPKIYKRHPSPTSALEYDLSSGFGGVSPLPGFARLRGPEDESTAVFVALLGFEGNRASYVAMELDPMPEVFAVAGVPGFRLEYPQVTHVSNQEFLRDFRAFGNIRYARASCPFEAFDALANIRRDSGASYMYVAPIGTKPHALGAICYALAHPEVVEIMYDHPVRKPGRTLGIGIVHFYTLKPSYVSG